MPRRLPPDRWSWWPRTGELGLLGVQGYSEQISGDQPAVVVFTICENVAPFRELRHVRGVAVGRADEVRDHLIAQLQLGAVKSVTLRPPRVNGSA